jgi:hypothetical protein
MSPRAPAGSTEAQADAEVIPMYKPGDAESLEMILDRRYKDLLCLTHSPKALTDALAGAAKWVAIRRGIDSDDDWGKDLPKGGTVRTNG